MIKPQKALPILLLLSLAWLQRGSSQKLAEKEFEGFEDDLLVLTKMSEKVALERLSIKTFNCQEKISILETDLKTGQQQRQSSSQMFELKRLPDQRVNEKLIFSGSRTPTLSIDGLPQTPLVDEPFTGNWIEAFSFENRLATDFRKLPSEQLEGSECVVFSFETVPILSRDRLMLLSRQVDFRHKGRVWIDSKKLQLIRIVGRQTKLPKGCRVYEYSIDFQSQLLFGRTIVLPIRIISKIELREKSFEIRQEYSDFRMAS